MKNCPLVVIISCIWDVVFILCFCGASDGSTLLTLAFPSINGATKATQHHLHGYGHPNFSGCAVHFNSLTAKSVLAGEKLVATYSIST
jgi:hypothetical protein